jgi:hypothetical protein
MYCPNCDAEVSVNAKLCSVCNADFAEGSAWRPSPKRPNKQTPKTIFSRVPRLAHAWQAVAVFVLAGPPIGLLTLAGVVAEKEPLSMVFNLMAIAGAFALGGPAAVITGFAYCGLALAVVYSFPLAKVRALLGALLGAIAAFLGAVVFYGVWLHSSSEVALLTRISIPAGVAAGLLSGWLLPVGKQPETL